MRRVRHRLVPNQSKAEETAGDHFSTRSAACKGNAQRDKFGDQLPNGGAHRFCITWETSDRAPVNESTETPLSPIHVFSVSLGPANYGFKIPGTYERAPEGQPNREAPSNFELAGPSPVQSMVKRSR